MACVKAANSAENDAAEGEEKENNNGEEELVKKESVEDEDQPTNLSNGSPENPEKNVEILKAKLKKLEEHNHCSKCMVRN